MNKRNILITTLSIILIGAVLLGIGSLARMGVVAEPKADVVRSGLANVRAYAPAVSDAGATYAVDSGLLFRQDGDQWLLIDTPADVIVSDVVVSAATPDVLYIGAANALTVYRTTNAGATWLPVPLSDQYIGGVTTLALDEGQRILYVGSDTAGIFRLRDVGSSMILSGHQPLNTPVIDLVADSDGNGLAFARTADTLYRAANFGLEWQAVDNLGSTPTALALANTTPATVYVGTVDRGLVESQDGFNWSTANAGLGFTPGTRLQIDALAVDPQQPEVVYVATSYLFGSTTLQQTPVSVSMSTDGAAVWAPVQTLSDVAVAELLPVAGRSGAVYALMANSRAPLAMGPAPEIATTAMAVSPVDGEPVATSARSSNTAVASTGLAAWVVAALAAAALGFALTSDFGKSATVGANALSPMLVRK